MSIPYDDTLVARNNALFAIVNGIVSVRSFLFAQFPDPTLFAPGTIISASDKASALYVTDGLAWSPAGGSSFPDTTGHANQFLTNDGAGVVSWAAVNLSAYLPLAGGNMQGDINMGTHTLGTSGNNLQLTVGGFGGFGTVFYEFDTQGFRSYGTLGNDGNRWASGWFSTSVNAPLFSGDVLDNFVPTTVKVGRVADTKWLELQPGEAGSPAYSSFIKGFANGDASTQDQVVKTGWNVNSGGGQVDITRASLWDAWESWYYTGPGDYQAERHLSFIPPGGVERRFLSFLGQNTGTTHLFLDSHVITIGEDAGTNSAMIQVTGSAGGGITLQSADASRKIAFGNTNNIEVTGPVNMATGILDATATTFYIAPSSTLGAFGGYQSGSHGYFLFTDTIARMASPSSNAYFQAGPGNILEFVTGGNDRMWLSDTALYPQDAAGVTLGTLAKPWGGLYIEDSLAGVAPLLRLRDSTNSLEVQYNGAPIDYFTVQRSMVQMAHYHNGDTELPNNTYDLFTATLDAAGFTVDLGNGTTLNFGRTTGDLELANNGINAPNGNITGSSLYATSAVYARGGVAVGGQGNAGSGTVDFYELNGVNGLRFQLDGSGGLVLSRTNNGTNNFSVNGGIIGCSGAFGPDARTSFLELAGNANGGGPAPVSAANRGRWRYNEITQHAELSENTGAYAQIATVVTLGAYLPLAGSTMTGNIAMGGHDITGLATIQFNGGGSLHMGTGTIIQTGNISSNADATYDIGTTSNRYENIYAQILRGNWIQTDGLHTGTGLSAIGATLINEGPATVGFPNWYSPSLQWSGQVWNGAATKTASWFGQARTVSPTASSNFYWSVKNGSSAFTDVLVFTGADGTSTQGTVYPATAVVGNACLGSPTNKWQELYVADTVVTFAIGTDTVNQLILPATTGTLALIADLAAYTPTSRTVTAGAGLTGGGDLSANRTFDVGAGVGISVAADSVAVDQAFSPTWIGTHTFNTNNIVFGANVGITSTAGTGALSFGSMTGATALPTGNLSWAAAAGKTANWNGPTTIAPPAAATMATPTLTLTPGAHTANTASTEFSNLVYTAVTSTFATGAITTQRERLYNASTYAFAGASTITDAYAEYSIGPKQGTNATITNKHVYGANIDSVGTVLTMSGFTAINTTAAANNAQQFSPMAFEGIGQGWDSTASSSKQVLHGALVRPIQTAGNPTSELVFVTASNAAAPSEYLKFAPGVSGTGLNIQNTAGTLTLTSPQVAATSDGFILNVSNDYSGQANALLTLKNQGNKTWTFFTGSATVGLSGYNGTSGAFLAGINFASSTLIMNSTNTFRSDGDNIANLGSLVGPNRFGNVYSLGFGSGTSTMTHTTTVATGSSRAGFIFNDTNAATTDKPISVQINAVEHAYIGVNGDYNLSWAAGIGTAQTVGLQLANTSAALVGAQQYSPGLALYNKTWETTGGTSQTGGWLIQAQGFNAATAKSNLNFYHNVNGVLTSLMQIKPVIGANQGIQITGAATAVMNVQIRDVDMAIGNQAGTWMALNYNISQGIEFNPSNSTMAVMTSNLFRGGVDNTTAIGTTALRFSNVISKIHTAQFNTGDALTTAQTVGISVVNANPAVVGTQSYSPALELLGKTWETTGGTSQTGGWTIQAQGTNAATATSNLVFYHNSNGTLSKRASIALASTDGIVLGDGGGTNSSLQLSNALGSKVSYGTHGLFVGSVSTTLDGGGTVSYTDGTGTVLLSAGNMTATVFVLRPDGDNTRALGDSTHRWATVDGVAYNSRATAMTLTTTVATGSARRGFIFNDTNAATTDKLFAIQQNGTDKSWFTLTGLNTPHLIGSSSAPTIATTSPVQLGTVGTPTVAITAGTDMAGTLTITTSTVLTAFVGGTEVKVATLTFNTAYSAAPTSVVIVPANNNAAQAQSGTLGIFAYVKQSTTATGTFDVYMIDAGAGSLTASTAYAYAYIVVQ